MMNKAIRHKQVFNLEPGDGARTSEKYGRR